MKVHPRNEGTQPIDMVLLGLMPIAIAVIVALLMYMSANMGVAQ